MRQARALGSRLFLRVVAGEQGAAQGFEDRPAADQYVLIDAVLTLLLGV